MRDELIYRDRSRQYQIVKYLLFAVKSFVVTGPQGMERYISDISTEITHYPGGFLKVASHLKWTLSWNVFAISRIQWQPELKQSDGADSSMQIMGIRVTCRNFLCYCDAVIFLDSIIKKCQWVVWAARYPAKAGRRRKDAVAIRSWPGTDKAAYFLVELSRRFARFRATVSMLQLVKTCCVGVEHSLYIDYPTSSGMCWHQQPRKIYFARKMHKACDLESVFVSYTYM